MLSKDDLAIFFQKDDVLSYHSSYVFPISKMNQPLGEGFSKRDLFPIAPNIFAIAVNFPISEPFKWVPVRDALHLSDHKTAGLISRGKQLLNWHVTSIFSGCCGAPNSLHLTELAKVCGECERIIYPAVFPIVIVLIEDGKKILLARSAHFSPGTYSPLAGFIELGETCENAVHREVAEEVGIKVRNIRYFSSQSWPFPQSLILGYSAEYDSGLLRIDPKEIEDARWFSLSELPKLPHPWSISRRIIDRFIRDS